MTQDEALALVKTGASIFLTGQPGSGKTHTVNRYIDALKRNGIDYAYTASTGIAATHGHGITIHAWSGIGVRESAHPPRSRYACHQSPARRARREDQRSHHRRDLDAAGAKPHAGRRGLPPCQGIDRAVRRLAGGAGRRFLPAAAGGTPGSRMPACCRSATTPTGRASPMPRPPGAILRPPSAISRSSTGRATRRFSTCSPRSAPMPAGRLHRERLAARQVEKDRLPAGCTLLFTHNAAVDEINQRALAKLPRRDARLRHDRQGPRPVRAGAEARMSVARDARAQAGRDRDVHQERPGRALRQRHARRGRGLRPRRGQPDRADAARRSHRGRALQMEDRRERQGTGEHHAGPAPARLGDDRA